MKSINQTKRNAFASLALSVALAILPCTTVLAADDTAAIKCVQQELNALGFRAGPVDGKVGGRTFLAGEAYIRYMKANAEPGWAQPSLNAATAPLWCEKVAEAHPPVAHFWRKITKVDHLVDAEDIFQFAYQFDVGKGVKASARLAAKWYLRAAEMGYAPAQRSLARLYESGRGVNRSEAEARRWYLAAAEQGDAQAQYVMGKHYSPDAAASLAWLWLAAKKGHAMAIAELEHRLDI